MKLVLWKLGNLEHKIIPSSESIDKLKKEINSLDENEEVQHVVWGPDLSVEVFDLDSKKGIFHQFKQISLD